jgi:3-methyladenine DNA glycosylase/8-oxoguanine DNA glycosylase
LELAQKSRFVITPAAPFDFKLTVKKPAEWSLFNTGEIFEANTLWTATRLNGRLVGLRLRSEGTVEKPRVDVTLFTTQGLPAGQLTGFKRSVATLIGADQELIDFYAMARKDDILRHTVEDLYGMHDTQVAYLFNSVVLSICLQMAKLGRSMKMMASINRSYGTPVSFDHKKIRVEPSADTIARLKPEELANRCNLGYRAKYLVGAAKMVSMGFPDIHQIMSMPPDDAKKKLMELPGIGDYAADIINPHGGFPIDAWSVDVFGKLFFGREPDDARGAIEAVKEEGLRRWGRFAWMAFFYVAQDLGNLSKRLGVQLRAQ